MPFFRVAYGCYLNATEIVEISAHGGVWNLHDRMGRTWQIPQPPDEDFFNADAQMLPARSTDMAIVVCGWVTDEKSGAMEFSDTLVPIIGWIVRANEPAHYGTPILAADTVDDDVVGILLPDGGVVVHLDRVYPDRKSFVAEAIRSLTERQRSRERTSWDNPPPLTALSPESEARVINAARYQLGRSGDTRADD